MRDDARGQKRVAAQIEEIVVDPDVRPGEDLFPQLENPFLERRLRRRERPRLCRGGLMKESQRSAVHLAVAGQRQARGEDDVSRNHIGGHPLGCGLTEAHNRKAFLRHDAGQQFFRSALGVSDGNGRLTHSRKGV